MIGDACDAFSGWLRDRPADSFETLEAALKGWVLDYVSPSCGIYITGGDYALLLQVALTMFARAAYDGDSFSDAFPFESLVGQQPTAFALPRDSSLLDARWYRRVLLGYLTPGRDGPQTLN